MALMYHPSNPDNPDAFFAKDWKYVYAPTVGELALLVEKYRTATAIWHPKERAKKNFKFAEWIVIDVDQGHSLDYALQQCAKYIHVIGTTRSHQKEKKDQHDPSKTTVCDRYRLFLRLETRTYDIDDFEETGKHWARFFQGDKSVAGAHAMVRPCRIVSKKYDGKVVKVLNGKEIKKNNRKAFEKKVASYRGEKIIPPYIKVMLTHGVSQRNNSVYKMTKTLQKCGFSQQEVADIIVSHLATFDSGDHEFSRDEALKTIENGFRY